jgi:hypothetical protein
LAADNLAILIRENENPLRFHRLAIGHHKKHRQNGQVSLQGRSRVERDAGEHHKQFPATRPNKARAKIFHVSMVVALPPRHRARVLDRIEPIVETPAATAAVFVLCFAMAVSPFRRSNAGISWIEHPEADARAVMQYSLPRE